MRANRVGERPTLLEFMDMEPLLPTQYFHPQTENEYTKLMHAMLDNAIRDWQGRGPLAGGRPAERPLRIRRLKNEAAHWLFDSQYEGPFSFVHACEVLGIDPSYLRRGLKAGKHVELSRHMVFTERRTQIRPERPHRRERA